MYEVIYEGDAFKKHASAVAVSKRGDDQHRRCVFVITHGGCL